MQVHVYFRNHHRPAGWLKEKDGLKPQMPTDTRWNSQLDCLETYTKNWKFYFDIAREHRDEIDKDVKKIIDDRSIYNNANDLFDQLKIIGAALDKFQSNETRFSKAYDIWKSLLENEDLSIYKTELQKRFKEAMEPFHALAFITDPTFLLENKSLSTDEEEIAFQWVREKHPRFMTGILGFTIKDTDIFPPSMFSPEVVNSVTPHKWWSLMKKKLENKNKSSPSPSNNNLIEMAEFLSKLHSCPPSSASLERVFSTFGFIWSKLRNKLGPQKVQKLVKIYRYYNHHN